MPEPVVRFSLLLFLAFAPALLTAHPAHAQQAEPVSAEYQERASELLAILKGSEQEEKFFAPSFLEAIPILQIRALVAQLETEHGEPESIRQVIPAGEHDGTVEISYARATLAMRMVLDRDKPHPVIGLQVTGANVTGDSLETITRIIKDLPGIAGFQAMDISEDMPGSLAGHNAEYQFAIGSTFKLYVLANLASQIERGKRRWNDVVPLNRKSLPSGVLQNWPDQAPLTLQTLATLMISISDNSATDILIGVLGQKEITSTVRDSGHGEPGRMLPLLTTLEAFALKMPTNDDLRQRYAEATDTEQVTLLETEQSRLTMDNVSIANLATAPRYIDQIEWFASPTDVNNLLRKIARSEDPIVRKLLTVNTIIPPGDALRWHMIGGKGGSEPGVVSFAFLAESKSQRTYAISGSWNNSSAPVENEKFLLIMNRLLNLIAER